MNSNMTRMDSAMGMMAPIDDLQEPLENLLNLYATHGLDISRFTGPDAVPLSNRLGP